ncbi:hypothetical protein E2C01_004982 [Portunus trituberculatus]|uniref:Protein Star n=1 Tax=Portunus trituberculatus TaxID=210409 RepID=A0A5B7CT25_PORTR|nr:hypothetical protein [Portunus trituberculatus]
MVLYQSNVVLNVLLLVLSGIILVSYINNYGLSLLPWASHACGQECLESYMSGPPLPYDTDILEVIRQKYLVPPPRRPVTGAFDINEPVWARLVDWNLMQQKLLQIWEGESPGVFVEVGAADGEFMSQTLMLERNLSWTGLLVEPDPRSYAILQQNRRNAWTSPLYRGQDSNPCAWRPLGSQSTHGSTRRFWLRYLEKDLPEHFQQLMRARSKLNDEILTGDEERGSTITVPCVPLSTLLLAARITTIDLLTVATGNEEDSMRVVDVIRSKKFNVKTMLVHFPMGVLLGNPYPKIKGYIMDMEHSTLLVKLYINTAHCKLLSKTDCKKVNHYDTVDACYKYLCMNFHTVWTLPSTPMKSENF